MIEHTTRSREDAVSLSLSNSLYPKTNTTLHPHIPHSHVTFLLSSHVREAFPVAVLCTNMLNTHYIVNCCTTECVLQHWSANFVQQKKSNGKQVFFFKKKEKPEGTEKALFLNERCSRNIKEYNQVIVDNHGRRTAKSIKT